jgi:hypothetical protein
MSITLFSSIRALDKGVNLSLKLMFGMALIRINAIFTQIAEELGAPGRATQDPGVS